MFRIAYDQLKNMFLQRVFFHEYDSYHRIWYYKKHDTTKGNQVNIDQCYFLLQILIRNGEESSSIRSVPSIYLFDILITYRRGAFIILFSACE